MSSPIAPSTAIRSAVVLDAVGLSTAQMQAIATEFNYAETTFVLPPRDSANNARVRIFTANSEVPFAGHPNVGTAFVLATQTPRPPARDLFEEIAGLVPVKILAEDGNVVGAELTAPQPLKRLSPFSAEHAAASVSLSAADIRSDRHAPIIVSVGMPCLVAELASREALKRAKPEPASFSRVLSSDGAVGIYIYTRDVAPAETPCDLQARMFFPWGSGLAEDPGHWKPHCRCRCAARRSRQHAGWRTEIGHRPGFRHGPAEPALDARAKGERHHGFRACRRTLRADDGRHVSAGRRGVKWSHRSPQLVMAGLDPRLSGSVFVDKAHGVDSSVFQAFGDVLGHEEGSSHAASE